MCSDNYVLVYTEKRLLPTCIFTRINKRFFKKNNILLILNKDSELSVIEKCTHYFGPPDIHAGADLGILRGGGGGGVRVQVRGNFHILTSKKKSWGGLNPLNPPGSATDMVLLIFRDTNLLQNLQNPHFLRSKTHLFRMRGSISRWEYFTGPLRNSIKRDMKTSTLLFTCKFY